MRVLPLRSVPATANCMQAQKLASMDAITRGLASKAGMTGAPMDMGMKDLEAQLRR